MQKASYFLNKPLVSISTCLLEGEICDMGFSRNFTKLQYLFIKSNCDIVDDYKILSYGRLYSIGNDVATVKNDGFLKNLIDFDYIKRNSPIGANVYTIDGEYVSNVIDIEFERNSGKTLNIILENNEVISVEKIVNFSKDNIIINLSDIPIKITSKKAKKIKIPSEISNDKVVTILEDETLSPIKENDISSNSIMVNCKSIIGKKAKIEISKPNFVVKKGTVITNEIIKKAQRYNAVKKLIISCLTNIDEDFY